METVKVGKGGAVILPSKLRRHCGIKEGTIVMVEVADGGLIIRSSPSVAQSERYSLERKAELLLSNAVDTKDYRPAWKEAERRGLAKERLRDLEGRYLRRKSRGVIGLGKFRSGMPDLASSKKHVEDFGR